MPKQIDRAALLKYASRFALRVNNRFFLRSPTHARHKITASGIALVFFCSGASKYKLLPPGCTPRWFGSGISYAWKTPRIMLQERCCSMVDGWHTRSLKATAATLCSRAAGSSLPPPRPLAHLCQVVDVEHLSFSC